MTKLGKVKCTAKHNYNISTNAQPEYDNKYYINVSSFGAEGIWFFFMDARFVKKLENMKLVCGGKEPEPVINENETNLINIILFLPIYFCYQITLLSILLITLDNSQNGLNIKITV